jgi:signal transduction histidine kinase
MTNSYDKLSADIESVKQIPIVSTMLEVICRTTGMGFAAIARVTEERWIACSVRDEIQFGLKPGGELKIETTLCNEIRDSHKAIIIDDVANDEQYRHHHTPRIYGLQSYISIPIFLKSGEFFGTLCAIDPNPAQLNNPKIIGMFNLFAELISFHLHSIDMMEQSTLALREANRQLEDTTNENRQYQHISNHNLQEPLRKIRVYTSMLVDTADSDIEKTRQIAAKVNTLAQRFTMMIKDISDYSDLNDKDASSDVVDLNKILSDVCLHLEPQLHMKNATINKDVLPVIQAIPSQMEQLFYHLVKNALKFSKPDQPAVLTISCTELPPYQASQQLLPAGKYCEIRVSDNGIGIEKPQLEKIFDIFAQLAPDNSLEGFGVGLAHCRKIVRNHGGVISAQSEVNNGATFSIVLPVRRDKAIIS